MIGELDRFNTDVAELAATPLWPLDDDELTACLRAAYRLEQTATTLQALLAQQAGVRGLPARHGSRTTRAWLCAQLRCDPRPARDLADLATALTRHPSLEQALLDGRVDARQATVIADTVDTVETGLADLDEIGPAEAATLLRQARDTLLDMAAQFPALLLRKAGDRILTHVAPHIAERAEEAALARQEARAHRARGFTMSAPRNGQVRLSGTLGLEDAALVRAALDPLCRPLPTGRPAPGGRPVPIDRPGPDSADPTGRPGSDSPNFTGRPDPDSDSIDQHRPAQQRADALVDVCRLALRSEQLPASGGEPAQLAVTIPYDPLTRALGTATTDTGARLSAATARRLACDARILPVVLGGQSQVLDLGRTTRLATGPLRRALHVRDGGCAFPGCDRPARWTDAHHVLSWTEGGATTLDNLVLLCRGHHRLIHHPTAGWEIRLNADGHHDFIPPATFDPARRPRRNVLHLVHNPTVAAPDQLRMAA
ncbi:HNH endonuclease signature motif containing protein [Paractinoplanes atraurantiacus]|uniref:HNH endonuclease signature motif containing protein n=1 Tax=Paractinoplanes atraurantiacus TaxID=1036182 RepID=UPI001FE6DF26|nr:HNH endonuclease signature motif containing protein [Actinoplanes atraurantiacus]